MFYTTACAALAISILVDLLLGKNIYPGAILTYVAFWAGVIFGTTFERRNPRKIERMTTAFLPSNMKIGGIYDVICHISPRKNGATWFLINEQGQTSPEFWVHGGGVFTEENPPPKKFMVLRSTVEDGQGRILSYKFEPA